MAPVDAALQELLRNDTERSTLALSTVQKIVNNILSHQDDPKYRRLRTENKAIKEKVLSAVGGGALLEALGFAAQGGDELVLPMQASPVTLLQARMQIDTALKRMAAEEQARDAAASGDELVTSLLRNMANLLAAIFPCCCVQRDDYSSDPILDAQARRQAAEAGERRAMSQPRSVPASGRSPARRAEAPGAGRGGPSAYGADGMRWGGGD